MATLNEVIKLVEAGFTAEQIGAMINQPEQPEQKEKPEQPEQKEKPANEFDARLDKLAKSIEAVGNMVIASNIASSAMPAQESVDDILAQVINPKSMEDKNNGSK